MPHRNVTWCLTFTATIVALAGTAPSSITVPLRSSDAALAASAGSQSSPAANTGAISGRVVDESNGAPITGAVVTLRWAGSAGDPIGLPPLDAQATDQAGRFLFAPVPAGRAFELFAAKAGYFDGAFGTRATERVVLAEGQWRRDADIVLARPAAISGTILDETGEPVVGVYVKALARILVAGEPAFASGPLTRTDDRGMYRLAPLTPGAYAVVVPLIPVSVPDDALADVDPASIQHVLPVGEGQLLIGFAGSAGTRLPVANGRRQAYAMTFHPGATSVAGATIVELSSGEDRIGVNVALRPTAVSRISGHLSGPTEAVAGRRLRLLPAGAEQIGIGGEAAIALTKADGSFTFLDVPDGEYSILAASGAPGYDYQPPGLFFPTFHSVVAVAGRFGTRFVQSGSAVMSGSVVSRSTRRLAPTIHVSSSALSKEDDFLTGRTPVHVSGADVTDAVVALREGVTIHGRFVMDTPADRASIVELSPYLDMVVEPAGAEPSVREIRAGVPPGSVGLNFLLPRIPPGTYVLRFLGTYAMVKGVTWSGKESTGLPFTVTGEDISGLVVTLTTEFATLRGAVRSTDGRAAARAAVIYFPTDPARWRRYGPRPDRLGMVFPATSGDYDVPRLPAGDYYVVAVDEGLADGWKDPVFLEAAARVGTRVTLDWGERRVQDLTPTTIAR